MTSPNGQLDLSERCRALELECEQLRERLDRLENPPVPPRRRVRAIVADGLFVLLAGIVVAAIVGGIAIAAGIWKLDQSEPAAGSTQSAPAATAWADAQEGPAAGGAVTETAPAESALTDAATTTAAEDVAGAAVPVRLEAGAVGGPSWLQVRRGGAEGKVVWEGILADGDTVNFEGKQFWIRVGDPTNLRLELNGERVVDLPTLAADLLVTETGASVVPPA